ncbi:TRAP transporter substrate-binding protein DctP [Halomonas daqingensis]|jgi:tripartite ATP-independent transporter DctP family solute receptor|uniref:TRAP transporter substrate-binding protein DctP n=1 Tax=Billgrantia desiderata TaxID=52021 RepID=A0ABS9B9R0_9GAMM|nr:C4-dicarboxylate TRAP transporter substrate-binding protein [Halomonas desiderata]MCE8013182.1 TRAP transporter substrate-binding protein DctP [Halomonas desiderata]MCE8028514.1 TRAP transporter substrate-binding protein DctP [Halomonas desiderata]MCE8044176.1 TRAP transporter substrate-binding protein DctP [Halomonas desiderata]MCE8048750.1 TRAP transporter substrate-binding protein DctP [Halomonas desiderata]NIC36444.1 TRAP transporter substrate-binding protein DctP [Halomonas desiderata]
MKVQILVPALALLLAGNAAQAAYQLNLSSALSSQDPIVQAMESASEAIAERSEGELTVRVFPNSQLGSDEDVVEQIRSGANIAILIDAGRLSEYQPELGILSAPYLVEDHADYDRITSSELYQEWVEGLADNSGLRLLNYNWFQGSRHMLTKKLVETPDDLRGVRVRTINSPVWLRTIESMGATPTPLPWSEVYSALQLGAIDGAEAQLTAAEGQNLHEVITHIALTGHIHLMTGIATSEQWYQSLPEELRTILDEELQRAGEEASQATAAAQDAVRERMEAEGVTFTEVDVELFRERVGGVYDELGYGQYRDQLTAGE